MARIAGVELPHHKRMEIALTYIYGIGRSAAQKILAEAKVDPARNSDDLSAEEQVRIRNVIDEKFKVEGDLRREVQQSIKRLMDLGCYRGIRHRRGLAGARSANAYQCAHAQGSAQSRRGQETIAAQGLRRPVRVSSIRELVRLKTYRPEVTVEAQERTQA